MTGEPSSSTRVTCRYCLQPQRGFAQVGDVSVCHPDWPTSVEDDCYRMVTVYGRPLPSGERWTVKGWRRTDDS